MSIPPPGWNDDPPSPPADEPAKRRLGDAIPRLAGRRGSFSMILMAAAVVGVIAVVVLAIGGASNESPARTAASDEREVRNVFARFYKSMADNDPKAACSMLTKAAVNQAIVGVAQLGVKGDCPTAFSAIRGMTTTNYGDIKTVSVAGDSATITVTGDTEQPPRFAWEDGRWLIDADGPDGQTASAEPSSERAASWPAAWCALTPAATRDEIQAAMGEPTETFNEQDGWSAFGYAFTAFYDEVGNVRQLDYSTLELSTDQKAKLTCADTR